MADLVTSRIFVDGEKGITAAKLNDIVASSVIQPAFYTSKPTASTADPADVMLLLKAGAYAQVPISTVTSGMDASQIWSVRLRSFNSIGNPNFSVDQKNVNTLVANPFAVADRWFGAKAGTLGFSSQVVTSGAPASAIVVPGTSFAIGNSYLRCTLTTPQASLGVNDYLRFFQGLEGIQFRELSNDVHSISLLVRSSVAGLVFGVNLHDPAAAYTLPKLCTIPTANTWTLITLPNLPVWTSSGNFSTSPGVSGYGFDIDLAAGSNYTAPSAGTWLNGLFFGAPGMSNFAASAVNSTFDVAFVQHEPGPVCSTFIDKPFSQNLDECLRYFCKSYSYGVRPGTGSIGDGLQYFTGIAGFGPVFPIPFKKPMATIPTVLGYAYDGTLNNLRDVTAGVNKAITTVNFPGDSGFSGFAITSPNAAAWTGQFHYTADTLW